MSKLDKTAELDFIKTFKTDDGEFNKDIKFDLIFKDHDHGRTHYSNITPDYNGVLVIGEEFVRFRNKKVFDNGYFIGNNYSITSIPPINMLTMFPKYKFDTHRVTLSYTGNYDAYYYKEYNGVKWNNITEDDLVLMKNKSKNVIVNNLMWVDYIDFRCTMIVNDTIFLNDVHYDILAPNLIRFKSSPLKLPEEDTINIVVEYQGIFEEDIIDKIHTSKLYQMYNNQEAIDIIFESITEINFDFEDNEFRKRVKENYPEKYDETVHRHHMMLTKYYSSEMVVDGNANLYGKYWVNEIVQEFPEFTFKDKDGDYHINTNIKSDLYNFPERITFVREEDKTKFDKERNTLVKTKPTLKEIEEFNFKWSRIKYEIDEDGKLTKQLTFLKYPDYPRCINLPEKKPLNLIMTEHATFVNNFKDDIRHNEVYWKLNDMRHDNNKNGIDLRIYDDNFLDYMGDTNIIPSLMTPTTKLWADIPFNYVIDPFKKVNHPDDIWFMKPTKRIKSEITFFDKDEQDLTPDVITRKRWVKILLDPTNPDSVVTYEFEKYDELLPSTLYEYMKENHPNEYNNITKYSYYVNGKRNDVGLHDNLKDVPMSKEYIGSFQNTDPLVLIPYYDAYVLTMDLGTAEGLRNELGEPVRTILTFDYPITNFTNGEYPHLYRHTLTYEEIDSKLFDEYGIHLTDLDRYDNISNKKELYLLYDNNNVFDKITPTDPREEQIKRNLFVQVYNVKPEERYYNDKLIRFFDYGSIHSSITTESPNFLLDNSYSLKGRNYKFTMGELVSNYVALDKGNTPYLKYVTNPTRLINGIVQNSTLTPEKHTEVTKAYETIKEWNTYNITVKIGDKYYPLDNMTERDLDKSLSIDNETNLSFDSTHIILRRSDGTTVKRILPPYVEYKLSNLSYKADSVYTIWNADNDSNNDIYDSEIEVQMTKPSPNDFSRIKGISHNYYSGNRFSVFKYDKFNNMYVKLFDYSTDKGYLFYNKFKDEELYISPLTVDNDIHDHDLVKRFIDYDSFLLKEYNKIPSDIKENDILITNNPDGNIRVDKIYDRFNLVDENKYNLTVDILTNWSKAYGNFNFRLGKSTSEEFKSNRFIDIELIHPGVVFKIKVTDTFGVSKYVFNRTTNDNLLRLVNNPIFNPLINSELNTEFISKYIRSVPKKSFSKKSPTVAYYDYDGNLIPLDNPHNTLMSALVEIGSKPNRPASVPVVEITYYLNSDKDIMNDIIELYDEMEYREYLFGQTNDLNINLGLHGIVPLKEYNIKFDLYKELGLINPEIKPINPLPIEDKPAEKPNEEPIPDTNESDNISTTTEETEELTPPETEPETTEPEQPEEAEPEESDDVTERNLDKEELLRRRRKYVNNYLNRIFKKSIPNILQKYNKAHRKDPNFKKRGVLIRHYKNGVLTPYDLGDDWVDILSFNKNVNGIPFEIDHSGGPYSSSTKEKFDGLVIDDELYEDAKPYMNMPVSATEYDVTGNEILDIGGLLYHHRYGGKPLFQINIQSDTLKNIRDVEIDTGISLGSPYVSMMKKYNSNAPRYKFSMMRDLNENTIDNIIGINKPNESAINIISQVKYFIYNFITKEENPGLTKNLYPRIYMYTVDSSPHIDGIFERNNEIDDSLKLGIGYNGLIPVYVAQLSEYKPWGEMLTVVPIPFNSNNKDRWTERRTSISPRRIDIDDIPETFTTESHINSILDNIMKAISNVDGFILEEYKDSKRNYLKMKKFKDRYSNELTDVEINWYKIFCEYGIDPEHMNSPKNMRDFGNKNVFSYSTTPLDPDGEVSVMLNAGYNIKKRGETLIWEGFTKFNYVGDMRKDSHPGLFPFIIKNLYTEVYIPKLGITPETPLFEMLLRIQAYFLKLCNPELEKAQMGSFVYASMYGLAAYHSRNDKGARYDVNKKKLITSANNANYPSMELDVRGLKTNSLNGFNNVDNTIDYNFGIRYDKLYIIGEDTIDYRINEDIGPYLYQPQNIEVIK